MIKTDFTPQTWALVDTGDANVYRILKADGTDWVAILRCNGRYAAGHLSEDGVTTVQAMVVASEMLGVLNDVELWMSENPTPQGKESAQALMGKINAIIEKAIHLNVNTGMRWINYPEKE